MPDEIRDEAEGDNRGKIYLPLDTKIYSNEHIHAFITTSQEECKRRILGYASQGLLGPSK